VFVGGKHNTTADAIEFFDLQRLPVSHHAQFAQALQVLDRARGENALERCYRFLLAADVATSRDALKHVSRRSVDTAEVRPELNHATNAAVIVGRRELTRGCFFDRRAFLPSYDPRADDASGTLLESVLAPALIVCSVRATQIPAVASVILRRDKAGQPPAACLVTCQLRRTPTPALAAFTPPRPASAPHRRASIWSTSSQL
jgi:hypothetical protein